MVLQVTDDCTDEDILEQFKPLQGSDISFSTYPFSYVTIELEVEYNRIHLSIL